MVQRRQILKLVGGGVVLSAAALAGFSTTRTPRQALRPWNQAGQYKDPRLFALSYAILAPNPHNRQPWMIELIGENALRVFRDKSKNLPETDPFERQLTIGMGCFLEQFEIAARQRGFASEVDLFPAHSELGENAAIADIRLVKTDAEPKDKDLFDVILQRRSCKEPYEARAISREQAEILSQYGEVITDPVQVEALKKISLDAWYVEYETPRTLKESIDLMRFGKSEINATPDGIDIGGPLLELLALTGTLNPQTMADPTSTAYSTGIDMYEAMLSATPNYLLIKTNGNSRLEQIGAGRQWLRANLQATKLGLSVQPVSQALQEYKEMAALYEKIHQGFAVPGETLQMFGRLGYGPSLQASPRWPIEKKLLG
ncbi:twin-arginine translocation pathway signal protein [Alphaproteobacteria bacterium]|nr:twin-arginine translocation pathway signal protein [Alphaproteobacteria bacterium]